MADVFISYPHEASEDASQLASALQAKGVDTWYAEENLASGSDWKKEISNALSGAHAVVFIVTPDHKPSSWQEEEYMTALESYWSGGKKVLMPILVGEAVPPKFLQHRETLKVAKKSDWERAADQLVSLLQTPHLVPIQPTKQAQKERTQRLRMIDVQMKRLHAPLGSSQSNGVASQRLGKKKTSRAKK